MTVTLMELVNELKVLRKGRGLFVSHIGDRVGSALRCVCEVAEEDGPAEIRQKVARRIENLAAGLPADLRVAVMAAFGIAPDARLPLYQDRVSWAATRLNRDPRTARRRIDDGIHQLAQLATVTPVGTAQLTQLATEPASGWRTEELRVTLALDRPLPEALEHRRIVSNQDGLAEIDLAVTLPVPHEQRERRSRELGVRVFHGGTLIDRGMESSARMAFTLALPRPLDRGESHDFVLHHQVPEGPAMQPHFACVPKHHCELFDLRVRFDPQRLPSRISVMRGAFQRDVDEPGPGGETVEVDQAGEIYLTFRNLSPGLAYGARWAY